MGGAVTLRHAIIISVMIAVTAFVAGRLTAPKPAAIEKTREVVVTREAASVQREAATHTFTTVQGPTRWRTERYDCPGGKLSEVTTVDKGPTESKAAAISKTETVAATSEQGRSVERLVVTPAPLPRWSLSALGGVSPRGPLYGAEVGVRVVGNWSVKALATSERTALVGIEWRW